MTMRAITLWPEWAWAIRNIGKDVENRSWPIPQGLVGLPIALHAGRHVGGRPGREAFADGCESVGDMAARAGHDPSPSAEWYQKMINDLHTQTSCIVMLVRFGMAVRGHSSPWSVPGQWQWPITSKLVLSEPVPCRGAQGIWTLPTDVEQSVRRQVAQMKEK